MELFTLGEGEYTERDVKEAARCLTGGLSVNNGLYSSRSYMIRARKRC